MALTPPKFGGTDLETVINDIESIIKTNFNTFATAMNTAKNDGITLKTLKDSAFMIQAQREAMNDDPFIFIMESQSQDDGIGPATALQPTIDIMIVTANANDDSDIIWKKLLRYREVLRAIFQVGWDDIRHGATGVELKNIPQLGVVLENSTELYTGIGVSLEVNFA